MESPHYRVLCVFLEIPICFFLQLCLPLAPEDLRNAVQSHVLSNPKGEPYCSNKTLCCELGPCELSLELPAPPSQRPGLVSFGVPLSGIEKSCGGGGPRAHRGSGFPLMEEAHTCPCEHSPSGSAVPMPLGQCKAVIWQA